MTQGLCRESTLPVRGRGGCSSCASQRLPNEGDGRPGSACALKTRGIAQCQLGASPWLVQAVAKEGTVAAIPPNSHPPVGCTSPCVLRDRRRGQDTVGRGCSRGACPSCFFFVTSLKASSLWKGTWYMSRACCTRQFMFIALFQPKSRTKSQQANTWRGKWFYVNTHVISQTCNLER